MTQAKLTIILLYCLVGGMLMFSKYRNKVLLFTFAVFLFMCMKMLVFKTVRPNAIKVSKDELRSKIEPGDLLYTFNVKERQLFSPYNIAHVLSNEDEVHGLYALEYNKKLYVMNTYTTELYEKRKKYFKNPDSIILLEKTKDVSGRLEPIEEFLNAESGVNSFVRVVKTKKKYTTFDDSKKDVMKQIANEKYVHCCMVIAKYLESQGVISNTSGYNDFLYYFPDVLRKKLGVISNVVYRVASE